MSIDTLALQGRKYSLAGEQRNLTLARMAAEHHRDFAEVARISDRA